MGENPANTQQEEELAKARKSMGDRIDPDEVIPGEGEPAPVVVEEPKAPETTPEAPVVEEPKVVADEEPPVIEPKKPNRPETFIPMPKYLSEKDEWKTKLEASERAKATAEAKVAELQALADQKDGTAKDEDIEAFMDKHGFTREAVDDLLNLASKRIVPNDVMSPEERDAVAKATAIIKEAEIEEAFEEEFSTIGQPAVVKAFPDATPEQLAKAKDFLDKVAHTRDNQDKTLDFLVYKHQEDIAKLITGPEVKDAPKNKKSMETSRVGAGAHATFTVDDYRDGKVGFETMADLDPAVRAQLIKDFDPKTYGAYVQYHKSQDRGIEVMRGGRKITLK